MRSYAAEKSRPIPHRVVELRKAYRVQKLAVVVDFYGAESRIIRDQLSQALEDLRNPPVIGFLQKQTTQRLKRCWFAGFPAHPAEISLRKVLPYAEREKPVATWPRNLTVAWAIFTASPLCSGTSPTTADDPSRTLRPDSAVLILGETGTGKEVIARAIHDAGPRRHRHFVAMNCAAIPTGLLKASCSATNAVHSRASARTLMQRLGIAGRNSGANQLASPHIATGARGRRPHADAVAR